MIGRRAAKYRRISDDREGRELGVTRQDEDLDELGRRHGLTIVADYEDNDTSASTRSTKPRPDYDRMLADARAGKFDVILAYTSGRLTRRPREHEDLIELAEKHGIQFIYVKSPSFDLSTAAGRRVARILAANDAGEAEDISERTRRDVKRRAEAAAFHGGNLPLGITGTREIVNGKARYAEFSHDHTDAARVRDAVRRLLAGESVYGISKDFGMTPRTLKRAISNPAIAGLREYDGLLYPTPWEPIVDREDWQRVVEILGDPARRKSETNQRKYMLSGLVFCHCGNRMTSTSAKRTEGPTYECAPVKTRRTGKPAACGGTRIVMRPLEEYITGQLMYVTNSPEFRQALAAQEPDDPTAELRKAILDDEEALQRLEDEYDDGKLPESRYRRRRARLVDRIEANTKQRDAAARSSQRKNLPSGDYLREVWSTRDDIWKRTVLAMFIERIEIGPHPAGVTSAPPRRRGEDEGAWRERFKLHRIQVFDQRVTVRWWV